jgi:hypothetical protein
MRKIVPVLIATALTVGFASPARGQRAPVRQDRYPAIDSTITVGAADTIRLLNRFVLAMAPAPKGAQRYDLQYTSRIPAADSVGRREQADRMAPYLGAEARQLGAERMVLALCDTRACAETREQPATWYEYSLLNGHWQRQPH